MRTSKQLSLILLTLLTALLLLTACGDNNSSSSLQIVSPTISATPASTAPASSQGGSTTLITPTTSGSTKGTTVAVTTLAATTPKPSAVGNAKLPALPGFVEIQLSDDLKASFLQAIKKDYFSNENTVADIREYVSNTNSEKALPIIAPIYKQAGFEGYSSATGNYVLTNHQGLEVILLGSAGPEIGQVIGGVLPTLSVADNIPGVSSGSIEKYRNQISGYYYSFFIVYGSDVAKPFIQKICQVESNKNNPFCQ